MYRSPLGLTGVDPAALSAAERRRDGFLQHADKRMDMHTLTFSDNERTLLIEVLGARVAQLPHEIHQTDDRAYRDMLEQKQSALQQLLKKVQGS